MFYVEVLAPMDCVFVGPFPEREKAVAYAIAVETQNGHGARVLTEAEKALSIEAYGALPLISPE